MSCCGCARNRRGSTSKSVRHVPRDVCDAMMGQAGQHISSLRPVIPAEFTDTLSCLCDKAPQSTLKDVERVFR